MNMEERVLAKAKDAKKAAAPLAFLSTEQKNQALLEMASALEKRQEMILEENAKDLAEGRAKGLSRALLDRLMLNENRIQAMAEGLRQTASLPDPVGEGISCARRPNGLEIRKIRVPLGVIGIIYEARPNVTVEAAGLCLKSGNAVILRGGSEAIYSNQAIVSIITKAAYKAGAPEGAIQFIESTDREAVEYLLKLNDYIDVVIPRGGAGLIKKVAESSAIPVIETGTGICHTFVDASANLEMAKAIALNAKVSRPSVCNALETLLVHQSVAAAFLPEMLEELTRAGVEARGCEKTAAYHDCVKSAREED